MRVELSLVAQETMADCFVPADSYVATYRTRVLRFLLEDGRIVDVVAVWDDSELRGQVVGLTGRKIVGVAELEATS